MRFCFTVQLMLLQFAVGFAQTIAPTTVCVFPPSIHESSGLLFIDSTHVLTHNDSGDSARVFLYNYSTCTIEKEIKIIDHLAVDIESITMDDSGYVYLADVGNNSGNRTDLTILKVKLSNILAYDSVNVQKIHYSYADQFSFTASNHNFDCEAMVHVNDSLYLFSKNHGIPGTYCKRYVMPDLPGTYSISPIDSISLPGWVTDAAIDTSGTKFVLNAETRLYVFEMSNASPGFDSLKFTLNYSFISQKEGVSFDHHNHLLLTDELFIGVGGKLYTVDLTGYIGIPETTTGPGLQVLRENGELICKNRFEQPVLFTVFSLEGKLVHTETIQPGSIFRYSTNGFGILKMHNNSYHQTVKF
ncbi:MAG TPA: hypothetical protein VK177_03140 [Flavobacteriales bacterium]|nr:hypothetical protein [Flavobacteriales bacterium]